MLLGAREGRDGGLGLGGQEGFQHPDQWQRLLMGNTSSTRLGDAFQASHNVSNLVEVGAPLYLRPACFECSLAPGVASSLTMAIPGSEGEIKATNSPKSNSSAI